MTREEEIIELTKRTCNAYRRQEPLERTCGGFQKCDCKCLHYNRCEAVYDAGWRKQIEAEWTLNRDGSGTCGRCHFTQRSVYDQDSYQRYCGCCGAKMKLKGE